MKLVRKTISITKAQNAWIEQQIEAGRFLNESEVFRAQIQRACDDEAYQQSLLDIMRRAAEGTISENFDPQDFWQRMKDKRVSASGFNGR